MSNKRLRKCLSKVATLAILLAVLVACRPGVTGDHEFTGIRVQELESFADRFFAREMRKGHIPGLALVVVQDGQVLLAKGYGYADLEGRVVPIDPDRTVMRIGSVSKLFVATAVMQLVERGELDLHADVNRYLNTFQLDDRFPEPVTLAHLLTHTAGFEDSPYQPVIDPAPLELGAGIPQAQRPVAQHIDRVTEQGSATLAPAEKGVGPSMSSSLSAPNQAWKRRCTLSTQSSACRVVGNRSSAPMDRVTLDKKGHLFYHDYSLATRTNKPHKYLFRACLHALIDIRRHIRGLGGPFSPNT